MKRKIMQCMLAVVTSALLAGCNNTTPATRAPFTSSYAIYGEFSNSKDSNKLMKSGLNRRTFNVIERQEGDDIKLLKDGVVSLQQGTYHISGFSMVTMEVRMPDSFKSVNYPGYAMIYHEQDEKIPYPAIMPKLLGVGNVAGSDRYSPSNFDLVYTVTDKEDSAQICVGHQSGNSFATPIYLSMYQTDGKDTSSYHVFARVSVRRMY